MSAQSGDFLTSKEVCGLLRISGKTLQRMRARRAINFIRNGGKYLYRRVAVDSFLANRETRAA